MPRSACSSALPPGSARNSVPSAGAPAGVIRTGLEEDR